MEGDANQTSGVDKHEGPVPAGKIVGATPKRWARKYDACVECGATEIPHDAKGLCRNCYAREGIRRRKNRGAPEPKQKAPTVAPAKENNDKVIVGLSFGPEILDEIVEKASDKLADRLIKRMLK